MGFNLGKVLGGIAGGVIHSVTGGLINPKINFNPPTVQQPVGQPSYPFNVGGPGGINIGTPVFPPSQGLLQQGQQKALNPGTALTAPGAGCAMVWDGTRFRTTHPNKAAYVTRGGGTSRWPVGLQLHPKGSVCVTHRKMNPGNGRAVVHAVRRVSAFHHLAKRVERVLARVAKPATRRGARHGSGCGCGSCKK
jgi:hypothetical protein